MSIQGLILKHTQRHQHKSTQCSRAVHIPHITCFQCISVLLWCSALTPRRVWSTLQQQVSEWRPTHREPTLHATRLKTIAQAVQLMYWLDVNQKHPHQHHTYHMHNDSNKIKCLFSDKVPTYMTHKAQHIHSPFLFTCTEKTDMLPRPQSETGGDFSYQEARMRLSESASPRDSNFDSTY